jgi:hypothetical protein
VTACAALPEGPARASCDRARRDAFDNWVDWTNRCNNEAPLLKCAPKKKEL